MKIQLIQTKLGSNYMKNGRDMMVFPLGISAIASYVRLHNPKANLEVVDGDFETDLEAKLDADIVGIQPNILNADAKLMQGLHDGGKQLFWVASTHHKPDASLPDCLLLTMLL